MLSALWASRIWLCTQPTDKSWTPMTAFAPSGAMATNSRLTSSERSSTEPRPRPSRSTLPV